MCIWVLRKVLVLFDYELGVVCWCGVVILWVF